MIGDRLEVGVGEHDRQAHRMLFPERPMIEGLVEAVDAVRRMRSAGAQPHLANTLGHGALAARRRRGPSRAGRSGAPGPGAAARTPDHDLRSRSPRRPRAWIGTTADPGRLLDRDRPRPGAGGGRRPARRRPPGLPPGPGCARGRRPPEDPPAGGRTRRAGRDRDRSPRMEGHDRGPGSLKQSCSSASGCWRTSTSPSCANSPTRRCSPTIAGAGHVAPPQGARARRGRRPVLPPGPRRPGRRQGDAPRRRGRRPRDAAGRGRRAPRRPSPGSRRSSSSCCCPRTPTTARTSSSRSAAPRAARRPTCSPRTCSRCTSATPSVTA